MNTHVARVGLQNVLSPMGMACQGSLTPSFLTPFNIATRRSNFSLTNLDFNFIPITTVSSPYCQSLNRTF
jgi:hypothetical protein